MKCTLCREEITEEPVTYKGKNYCCQACAFDASVRLGSMCGSQSTVEAGLRFERSRSQPAQGPAPCRVIAIDGPVAVGKSTVGKLVARKLGYQFMDTGAMYRALTFKVLQSGIDPSDGTAVADMAARTEIKLRPSEETPSGYIVLVDGVDATDEIRTPRVEASVSLVSRIPAVRRFLVERQRELARDGQVVVVGRDIATVVLPEAELKVFLTASPEERAIRRFQELRQLGKPVEFDSVLAELRKRDTLDSTRADSPLKPAADSRIVDTDKLTLQEAVERVLALAMERECS